MNATQKLWFPILLLLLVYVVLGGFVVPHAGVFGGHIIMVALAVLLYYVAKAFPERVKQKYHDVPKSALKVLRDGSKVVCIISPLLIIVHLIILLSGHRSFWTPELWAMVLMLLIGLFWAKERYGR